MGWLYIYLVFLIQQNNVETLVGFQILRFANYNEAIYAHITLADL